MNHQLQEDLVELWAQILLEDIRLNPDAYANPREGTTVTPPAVKRRAHLHLIDTSKDRPSVSRARGEA